MELNEKTIRNLVGKYVVGVKGQGGSIGNVVEIIPGQFDIEASYSTMRIFPYDREHGAVVELDKNRRPVEIYEF